MTESQEMTVIERAARALWQDRKDAGDYSPADTWEDAPESDQAACRRKARAVLQAIREPSEGMLPDPHRTDTALYQAVRVMEDQSVSSADAFRVVWQAMIDAALAE